MQSVLYRRKNGAQPDNGFPSNTVVATDSYVDRTVRTGCSVQDYGRSGHDTNKSRNEETRQGNGAAELEAANQVQF